MLIICSVLLIIFILVLFFLCSCFSESSQQDYSSNKAEASREIYDIYDRCVSVPSAVNTISSVGSATRFCVYAGVADKLISITELDHYNVLRPYTLAYSEQFENLPITNNGNHLNSTDVDIEKIRELNPDVIISSRGSDECDLLQEKTKIPVIGVFSQDEMFGGCFEESLKIIGELCNCSDQVNSTINKLDEYKQELSHKILSSDKFYRGAINYKGSKGLCGTISNYCAWQSVNLSNVADRDDINGAYDTSYEDIINWNPAYIVIDYENKDKVLQEYNAYKNSLENIDAIKNTNVFCVAPFNNNGTNVEYAICEAYYVSYLACNKEKSDQNFLDDLDQKFSEVITTLLHKNVWQELKDGGVEFTKLNIED